MTTIKLYYDDSSQCSFTARVVDRRLVDGRPALVLDRTCFYPTSGGQPHDTGRLNGVPVIDVLLDEESGDVLHLLEDELSDAQVQGEIDWPRRFDHMQQHTGQHILSEACVRLLNATTVSFHLSEASCTIDLNRAAIEPEDLRRVEDLANAILFEDRPIQARIVSQEELAKLPLRKPPTVAQNIRVVEVGEFDWSACGGTHCQRSGQVGLIRVAGAERRGSETRVSFLCGWRVLRDLRQKDEVLGQLSAALTTSYTALPAIVQKLDEELRVAQRQVQKATETLAGLEAQTLLGQAERIGSWRVVAHTFADREFVAVKQLAGQLLQEAGVVVLFGWKGPEKGQLLLGRAADVSADMGSLLRTVCKIVGGGGGGKPDMAQGGGMLSERVEEAVALARQHLDVLPPA